MAGASIEATLELWASSLRDVKARLRPMFGQERVAASAWTDDPKRTTAAHVLDDVSFATKPQMARKMVAHAIATKVPFSFVSADSVCGTGELETALRKARQGLCSGRCRQSSVPFLGQEADGSRERREDRAKSSQTRMAAPVSRRWNQRRAPA